MREPRCLLVMSLWHLRATMMLSRRSSKIHHLLQSHARQYIRSGVARSSTLVSAHNKHEYNTTSNHYQVDPTQATLSSQNRKFTTAYQGTPSDGKHNHHLISNLIPYQSVLKDGRRVEVDFFRHSPTDIVEDEWFAGMALMNLVIREGRSWPFEEEFISVEDWRGYFLSHTAFVVRALDNGMDAAQRNSSSKGEILGCFYIKPNFPGRCSHVCNGGFITAPRFRGLGIGRLMGKVFLKAAKDLGYKSVSRELSLLFLVHVYGHNLTLITVSLTELFQLGI